MKEDIFEYSSYRDFLKKFIEEQKINNKKYSYSYYSQLIGSSEPYLKQVLAGRRKLTLDKAKILSKKIRLGELESSYFLTLVMTDNAKTEELKSYFNDILERMKELRPLNYEDREKFRTVFHNTKMWEIYTLLGLKNSSLDYEWIKSKLKSSSELPVIKKYISALKNHNLIDVIKSEVKTNNVIVEHGEDLLGIYINSMKRAIEYLLATDQREKLEYFDAFCMIVSNDDYLKIQKVLEEAKSKIAQISLNSKTKDRIAFFNSNFFFVSK
jgi:uncharacterized protein (TIGR02147 family)